MVRQTSSKREPPVPVLPPDFALPPDLWRQVVGRLGLSTQKANIIALMMCGKSDKDIAQELRLSVHTIRSYVDRLFAEFGVRHRVELPVVVLKAVVALTADSDSRAPESADSTSRHA